MRSFSIYFICILTLFSLFLRFYRINEPGYYYFDEVYHAVTAKAYADNNPAAYDPFAPPPREGTAYDWLHPPLAKLIQAGSIKIFGDNTFGWRFPSVVFGTAIIPATFIFALILFGPVVAIFSGTVVAFENLTFVMSRITMNDVFLVFFLITSFIFFSLYIKGSKNRYLLITAVFLGLSVATKWPGAYGILLIFFASLYYQIKKGAIHWNIILLLVIPIIIYVGSYGQFWIQGHTVSDYIDLHKQIWWYQNREDLQHSYGTTPLYCVPQGLTGPKEWCPWILNIRGVYFSFDDYGEKLAGYIYALGNPLIFWAGVISISYLIGKYLDERNDRLLLVIAAYFIFWVPWVFSPRIMFLYHYLPSIPFLAISLGVALGDIYKTKVKFLAIVILLFFIATFFYLYPISSGWPMPTGDVEKYMWINKWR